MGRSREGNGERVKRRIEERIEGTKGRVEKEKKQGEGKAVKKRR